MSSDYEPGTKIFAKMKGYPHWPARIDKLQEGAVKPAKGKFPIFFYGTHETAFLGPKDIFLYEKHKHKYHKENNRPAFNAGLWEIIHNPDVVFQPPEPKKRNSAVAPPNEENPAEVEQPVDTDDEENEAPKQASAKKATPAKKARKPSVAKKGKAKGEEEDMEEDFDEESPPPSDDSEDEDFQIAEEPPKSAKAKKTGGRKRKKSEMIEEEEEEEVDGDTATKPPAKKRRASKGAAVKANAKKQTPKTSGAAKSRAKPKKNSGNEKNSGNVSDANSLASSLSSDSEEEEEQSESSLSAWKKKEEERKKEIEKKRLEEQERKEKEEKERVQKAMLELKKEKEAKGEDGNEAGEDEDLPVPEDSTSKKKVKKKKMPDFVTPKKAIEKEGKKTTEKKKSEKKKWVFLSPDPSAKVDDSLPNTESKSSKKKRKILSSDEEGDEDLETGIDQVKKLDAAAAAERLMEEVKEEKVQHSGKKNGQKDSDNAHKEVKPSEKKGKEAKSQPPLDTAKRKEVKTDKGHGGDEKKHKASENKASDNKASEEDKRKPKKEEKPSDKKKDHKHENKDHKHESKDHKHESKKKDDSKRKEDEEAVKKRKEKERKIQEEKERKKQEKYEQKKKEKKEQVHFSRAEQTLMQMDTEIKKSLSTENMDINKCAAILDDLSKVPMTAILLKKNPSIMQTVKRCRKFKGSEVIRSKGASIFDKFKAFFAPETNDVKNSGGKLKENKDPSEEKPEVTSSTQPTAASQSTVSPVDATAAITPSPMTAPEMPTGASATPAANAPVTTADSQNTNSLTPGDNSSATVPMVSSTSDATNIPGIGGSVTDVVDAQQTVNGVAVSSSNIPVGSETSPTKDSVSNNNNTSASLNHVSNSIPPHEISMEFLKPDPNTSTLTADTSNLSMNIIDESIDQSLSASKTQDVVIPGLDLIYPGAESNNAPSDMNNHSTSTTSHFATRPLSIPLPPGAGDDMEIDEDSEEGENIIEDNTRLCPPPPMDATSPVIPFVNQDLSSLVFSAVKHVMAQAEAPPVDTDAEITANSELTGDEDEELLESKRRDLNARIAELMRQEEAGGELESDEEPTAETEEEETTFEKEKPAPVEEEEPLIDDDELHNLLGV